MTISVGALKHDGIKPSCRACPHVIVELPKTQQVLINNCMTNSHKIGTLMYGQTSIKRPLKGNVKSGLLKRWSLRKGLRV